MLRKLFLSSTLLMHFGCSQAPQQSALAASGYVECMGRAKWLESFDEGWKQTYYRMTYSPSGNGFPESSPILYHDGVYALQRDSSLNESGREAWKNGPYIVQIRVRPVNRTRVIDATIKMILRVGPPARGDLTCRYVVPEAS